MSELTATRVREHAERLRLTHLSENLDQLVARAEQATMGYLEFVDLVLEEEVDVREAAGSPTPSSCRGCPTTRAWTPSTSPSSPTWAPARSATSPRWSSSKPRPTSASSGHPGVGKTMLAVGLAIAACQAGFSVYFTTLDDLVRNLTRPRPRAGSPRSCRPPQAGGPGG
jgi:hypothetical protein